MPRSIRPIHELDRSTTDEQLVNCTEPLLALIVALRAMYLRFHVLPQDSKREKHNKRSVARRHRSMTRKQTNDD
jgi:hypothetical protein